VASPIGQISEPRSDFGRYLAENWERVSLVDGESLVYWLRKLVFRGAWLDHRVKQGLLEVAWDDDQAEFGYRDPYGDRTLLELAPVPSWRSAAVSRLIPTHRGERTASVGQATVTSLRARRARGRTRPPGSRVGPPLQLPSDSPGSLIHR